MSGRQVLLISSANNGSGANYQKALSVLEIIALLIGLSVEAKSG